MEDTFYSGKEFIAYKGNEYNSGEILRALMGICPMDYAVYNDNRDDCVFAKIGINIPDDNEPYYNSEDDILTVSGYNIEELERTIKVFKYDYHCSSLSHLFLNFMYVDYKTKIFKELANYMSFCSVILDGDDNIIAGVTEPNGKYTHLYYGYTKKKRELMFSNDEKILMNFCDEIHEMPNNTYMKNGILYDLYGEKLDNKRIKKDNDESFIKNSTENANSIIDGLNKLILQVTSESAREQIEQIIKDYFSSDDSKKVINTSIKKEIDNETKKQVLMLIKNSIEEQEKSIKEKLEEKVNEKLEEYTSKISIPVIHVIKQDDKIIGQTAAGFYHEKFEQILTQVQLDEPIMLIGPAGSGKNVAVSQVADALGQHMYYTNNASNEFKLTGFIDAGGNYRDTEFYKAFKNGGVFFLDEIDTSDPSALIVINSALANGYMAFPHETIDRHPDFRIIAAANTWGKGADLQYVGRNVLDAATLDRFDNIFFDYDRKLEKALYPNDEVLEFMWSFRDAVYESKIPYIVSTRAIGKVYKKEINGIPVIDTLTSNVIKNLGEDDLNTIIGNMVDIDDDNKYYDAIRNIRLVKKNERPFSYNSFDSDELPFR